MRGALGGPRLLLRRLREVMAEPVSAQARLDKIVILIAQNMVAEVCSVYVLRADQRLELYATEGLKREAVHLTLMRAGEGLVGMHKDVKAGKMTGFEFLRVEVDAQQRICYVSMPGGAPPTSFCAVEVGERRVVFENREHDFPQRILYWLDGEGRLHARIEGPAGSGEQAMEWVWGRLPV